MPDKEGVRTVPHIHAEEGSRRHVISYSTEGAYCSEPDCEINVRASAKSSSGVPAPTETATVREGGQ